MMSDIMIYAIENTVYIQSNQMMQDVEVSLSSENDGFSETYSIQNSCYEKFVLKAHSGKLRVKVVGDKQVVEKQIYLLGHAKNEEIKKQKI